MTLPETPVRDPERELSHQAIAARQCGVILGLRGLIQDYNARAEDAAAEWPAR